MKVEIGSYITCKAHGGLGIVREIHETTYAVQWIIRPNDEYSSTSHGIIDERGLVDTTLKGNYVIVEESAAILEILAL